MQSLSYTYDSYLICMGLGPSISSVIAKSPAYTGLSYASSPVQVYRGNVSVKAIKAIVCTCARWAIFLC